MKVSIDSYKKVLELIEILVKTANIQVATGVIKELDQDHKVGPLFTDDCLFKKIASDPRVWIADIGMTNEKVMELIQKRDQRPRIRLALQSSFWGSIALTFVFEQRLNSFVLDVYEHITFDPSLKTAEAREDTHSPS